MWNWERGTVYEDKSFDLKRARRQKVSHSPVALIWGNVREGGMGKTVGRKGRGDEGEILGWEGK